MTSLFPVTMKKRQSSVLSSSFRRKCPLMWKMKSFRLILVDDGSNDATWSLIEHLRQTATNIVGVKLSRNFGHQAALMAGLSHESRTHVFPSTRTYRTISTLLAKCCGHSRPAMRSALACGPIGKRTRVRGGEPPPHITAYSRYWACGSSKNHADFRLMSRKALQALLNYRESESVLAWHCAGSWFQDSDHPLLPRAAPRRRNHIPCEKNAVPRSRWHYVVFGGAAAARRCNGRNRLRYGADGRSLRSHSQTARPHVRLR